jgi:MFS family permease
MTTLAEQSPNNIQISSKQDGRNRIPLFSLFTANIISFIGDRLMLLAIPWFVLQTTGSITQTGITAFFTALPNVLSAFFSGAIIDRLGYKRASVIGDIASGVGVMLIPLLYYTVGLGFWQLQALVFLTGLLTAPAANAQDSMVPELIAMAQMRMERATSMSDGIRRVSGFIGMPLAGVLIVLIGTNNLLWLDAVSFFVSALLIAFLIPATPPTIKATEKSNYFADLRDGLRYVRGDLLMLSLIITVLVTNLLDAAFFSVILPGYVKHYFGTPVALGIMSAAIGGGAFLGTIIFGVIGHRLPRWQTLGISFTLGGGLRFWAFALMPVLPFLIVVQAIAGFFIGPVNPLFSIISYERIPQQMRARVFGILGAGSMAGVPLGVLMSGYVVNWIGMQPTLMVIGVIYTLATLSLLVNPALRQTGGVPSARH